MGAGVARWDSRWRSQAYRRGVDYKRQARLASQERVAYAEKCAARCLAESEKHTAAAEASNPAFHTSMSVLYLGMVEVHRSTAKRQRSTAALLHSPQAHERHPRL